MSGKVMRRHVPTLNYITDGMMLALWNQGCDTYDIAKRLELHEYQVVNRLHRLRGALR